MGDWVFPNAIAVQVRRKALERGQTPLRGSQPDDDHFPLPIVILVSPHRTCPGGMNLVAHTVIGKDPFCNTCGFLVDEG